MKKFVAIILAVLLFAAVTASAAMAATAGNLAIVPADGSYGTSRGPIAGGAYGEIHVTRPTTEYSGVYYELWSTYMSQSARHTSGTTIVNRNTGTYTASGSPTWKVMGKRADMNKYFHSGTVQVFCS